MLAKNRFTETVSRGKPIRRAKRFWRLIDSSIRVFRSGPNRLGAARPRRLSQGRRMVHSMWPHKIRAIQLARALNFAS